MSIKYFLKNKVIIKKRNDGYFTIKVKDRRTSLKVGDMIVLLLQLLREPLELEDITKVVAERYTISYDQAEIYASKIIEDLLSKEIIGSTRKGSFPHKKKIIYRDSDRLSRVVLVITNKCNFSCLHCDIDSSIASSSKEVSIDCVKSILPQLVELGVDQLVVTGGEPFLKPNFENFIEHLSEYDFQIILYSNGSLISPHHAKMLSNLEDLRVQIPLDGTTSATHEFLRKSPHSFEKAIGSIKLLLNHGIRVSVGTVIFKQNLGEMMLFPDFLNEIGVNEWVVSTLMKIGRATSSNNLHLSEQEFERFLVNFFRLQEEYPSLKILNNIFDGVEAELTGSVCDIWEESITIMPNGEVIPCERLPYMVLGNIQTETVNEILQKDEIISRHKNFIESLRVLCKKCDYEKLCGWGCPGVIISNKVQSPCSNLVDPISCRFFRVLDRNVILQRKLGMCGEEYDL